MGEIRRDGVVEGRGRERLDCGDDGKEGMTLWRGEEGRIRIL